MSVANFPATTNVAIDGSANTVKLETPNPLPVRDVDNPAKHFYDEISGGRIPDGSGSGVAFFQVPAQKRAVIEYVSADSHLPTGQKIDAVEVDTSPNDSGQMIQHYFGATFQATDNLSDYFVTSQPTRLYSVGTVNTISVRVVVYRNNTTGDGIFAVSLSGYLVDVP